MTENPALAFNLYNYHQQPAAAAPPDSRRSRWNPTPEQLMTLKELYRCGIKTPTAQQIRQVTAMLRRFGKVEGKSVFYWFQNNRARERQKIRREMAMSQSHTNEKQEQRQNFTENLISSLRNKASAQGLRRTSLEVEQQNKWTPHSNCTTPSTRSDQESSSVIPSVMQERMSMVKSHSSQTQCINAPVIPLGANPLDCDHCGREIQTLELFPLQSDNLKGANVSKLPLIGTGTKYIIPNFRVDRYLHLF